MLVHAGGGIHEGSRPAACDGAAEQLYRKHTGAGP